MSYNYWDTAGGIRTGETLQRTLPDIAKRCSMKQFTLVCEKNELGNVVKEQIEKGARYIAHCSYVEHLPEESNQNTIRNEKILIIMEK